jgi:hypothetical protein
VTDQFIYQCLAEAANLGLFLAGQPEEAALLALHQTRERMAAELAEEFGDDAALVISEAFVAAVIRVKIGIEEASVTTGGMLQ